MENLNALLERSTQLRAWKSLDDFRPFVALAKCPTPITGGSPDRVRHALRRRDSGSLPDILQEEDGWAEEDWTSQSLQLSSWGSFDHNRPIVVANRFDFDAPDVVCPARANNCMDPANALERNRVLLDYWELGLIHGVELEVEEEPEPVIATPSADHHCVFKHDRSLFNNRVISYHCCESARWLERVIVVVDRSDVKLLKDLGPGIFNFNKLVLSKVKGVNWATNTKDRAADGYYNGKSVELTVNPLLVAHLKSLCVLQPRDRNLALTLAAEARTVYRRHGTNPTWSSDLIAGSCALAMQSGRALEPSIDSAGQMRLGIWRDIKCFGILVRRKYVGPKNYTSTIL